MNKPPFSATLFVTALTRLLLLAPALVSAQAVEGGASAPPATALSLPDAIAMVLSQNYSVRIQAIEPEVSRENLRSAHGVFDPVASFGYDYSYVEVEGFDGASEDAGVSASVGGLLPWGTGYDLTITANDRTSPFSSLTPTVQDDITSTYQITVTQPVLRGLGRTSAFSEVRLSEVDLAIAEEEFRATVISAVRNTVLAYNDLFQAQQNLAIAISNRDLAAKLLSDNRKRVESGAMAPLDIVQAESEVALREVTVITSERILRAAENRLKGLIIADPDRVLDAAIAIQPPPEPREFPTDPRRDLVQALQHRPDFRIAEFILQSDNIILERDRREALPDLRLFASYGRSATKDTLGSSWSELFGSSNENYAVGAVVSVPIFNRTRDAAKARAYLRRNQSKMELEALKQEILLQLDDAATRVRTNWQRILAARRARELAEKSLQAEEKKLQAGTSTTFVVLRLQGDLADAETREQIALTDYHNALEDYHLALGTTLVQRRINLN